MLGAGGLELQRGAWGARMLWGYRWDTHTLDDVGADLGVGARGQVWAVGLSYKF